jgi:hypothetical protein
MCLRTTLKQKSMEKRKPAPNWCDSSSSTMSYGGAMCRNITMLRGLEPPATHEEIQAAALQYARKVGAVTSGPLLTTPAFTEAVEEIAAATEKLLGLLPARRVPPPVVPPNRRRAQKAT